MLWLEDYDREKQKEIAQKMDLNLSEFYMLVVWVLLVFIAVFFFIEWRRNQQSPAQRRQKSWKKFLLSKGILYGPDLTLKEVEQQLEGDLEVMDLLQRWQVLLYQESSEVKWKIFEKL